MNQFSAIATIFVVIFITIAVASVANSYERTAKYEACVAHHTPEQCGKP